MNLDKVVLGIELDSTRIKAVLLDENRQVASTGEFVWENKLVNGIWTYDIDEIHTGLKSCYADLKKNFEKEFKTPLCTVAAIGVSGMMHGYMPFDKNGKLLSPFRTWRNTVTGEAASILTEEFGFNIPQRWSIAHLYQSILADEDHIDSIDYLTTLCGYIHRILTGERVLGIGEASGMFPINSNTLDYDADMMDKFEKLISDKGYSWKLKNILPRAMVAGQNAGYLTEEGALFLDETGTLKAGIPFAAPEGDMQTGMVATNSVKLYTGNVSAGTSVNLNVVVDHLPAMHKEIDIITTPSGASVVMAHCNNCTSDINAWVKLFGEFAEAVGVKLDKGDLYTLLFKKALEGDTDCGGLLSFNYISGESITGFDEGRPVFLRSVNANFNLANFMRTHLMSALATLKLGVDLLVKEENVRIDKLYGHGGYFKTELVGQKLLSAAAGSPVSVMSTAGEGGPYGMALLAAYMVDNSGEALDEYLENKIFANVQAIELMADKEEIEGFNRFMENYNRALPVEKAAIEVLK